MSFGSRITSGGLQQTSRELISHEPGLNLQEKQKKKKMYSSNLFYIFYFVAYLMSMMPTPSSTIV